MRAGNLRQTAVALFRAALAAVEPAGLLARAAPETRLPHPIESYDRIFLVGAGKASLPLARAAVPRFPPAAGCLAVPHGYASLGETEDLPAAVELFEAGHPVPDGSGRRAAARTLALARQAGPGDLLVVLVSGGGSSLWPAFAPGITLADARRAFTLLLEAGCPIDRLNALRKHISLIQGGRLARAAAPATVLALLLSDVPGDAPAVIAGGPAAADPSTFAEAAAVVDDYGLKDAMPPAITAHLRRGAAGREEETIKPGDPDLDRVTTLLLGNNATALTGAAAAARRRGFRVESSADPVQGEARQVGAKLAGELRLAPGQGPLCLLRGGETTVTLRGRGRGGRNQETALAAARALAGDRRLLAFLSAGTDGIDGPTPAAGALVTERTARDAAARGIDLDRHLAENDSHTFFTRLGGLVETGPTQTNVMDLMIGLRG